MAKKNFKQKKEEASQIHGALPTNCSLYDVMGKKTFPYEEKTVDAYRKRLDEMDFADLQRHAVEVANILPNVDKRNILIDKLEREYIKRLYAFVGQPPQGIQSQGAPDIMKILSRGK